MINKKNILIIIYLIASLFFFSGASAATLYLVPENKSVEIGEEFNMDVRIDTEEAGINAAQAEISFSSSSLEVLDISKRGSSFSFWAEEPKISEQSGIISFIGGSTKGVSGTSLHVIKIKFKAIGSETSEITMSDAVVVASDGRGTNVLSSIKGASIFVGSGKEISPIIPVPSPEDLLPTGSVEIIKVEQPKKIERKPVISGNLPDHPELRVPLYPDETRWYNHLGELTVFWELPSDISEISTRLSGVKDEKPGIKETELFTGRNLGILNKEGVWYARVQFKNNIGWGNLAYYKISIDTTAPNPFEIEMDALVSDDPVPEIRFETQDALSGISHALVFVDNNKPVRSTSTSITLPAQKPGNHKVMVRVFDLAGNSVEDDLVFEVLPLPTPTINFIPESTHQDEALYILGNSIPGGFVDIKILNDDKMEVFNTFVETDSIGGWEASIAETFSIGSYSLVVSARDIRGAVSYSVEPKIFKIKPRIILSLGFMDLGWFEIFFFVVLIFIIILGGAFWYYLMEQRKREAYQIVASRDVDKISNLLTVDLEKIKEIIKQAPKKTGTKIRVDLMYYHNKMKDNVEKMKKYVGRELKKLR